MIRRLSFVAFATSKPTVPKANAFIEALKYMNQMKPYIVPFFHKDP